MAAMNMTQRQFQELIQGDQPVLVDFWAPWCGYCRRIDAAYEKVAQSYEGKVLVGKVNVDEQSALETQEDISLIPTLVLYRRGKRLGSIVAPDSRAAIDRFIRQTLNI